LRISTEPGIRIRLSGFRNCASALPFFYGCDGLRIRASTRRTVPWGSPMTLPLVTADERARLLAHGGRRRWPGLDPLPVVRLFTPDAHATWLLAALDPPMAIRPTA
jgi:hypothetical protein